jgi:membrane associated rhomboid family serine protease
MNAQKLLLAVTLVFGVMETIDIPHTGAPAAVFALLFFACAAWLWRRRSLIATAIVTLLLLVEVTQAHTWKGVSMPAKVWAMVAGTIGLVAVVGIVVDRVRNRRADAPALQ